ncbi:unnamed protein product [Cyclocybe aegerita]|uniref:Protein kinase domain-containing protein n=1 Tax=Cyclocybe aegerita TaxID=1973307 RepID=A0A8S0VST1_CYCAE|nr:unnamed protein product [Cyclocybe aegerita]
MATTTKHPENLAEEAKLLREFDKAMPSQGLGKDPDDDCASDYAVDASYDRAPNDVVDDVIDADGSGWILNMTTDYGDGRKKMFITYMTEQHTRRVTITHSDATLISLSEQYGLPSVHSYDKARLIYEAIRDSLCEINFYETVTNLSLDFDDRLHIHVCKETGEIIRDQPVSKIQYLEGIRTFEKSNIVVVSHISGFVYQVKTRDDDKVPIMKEIPSPAVLDRFFYKIKALYENRHSKGIIDMEGIVVDSSPRSPSSDSPDGPDIPHSQTQRIQAVLIAFANNGLLADWIYNYKEELAPWETVVKWVRQLTGGLSDLHESGFVHGDFTLSNIVLSRDNAKIIDINRCGCPKGWHTPEMQRCIENGEEIELFIGVKSDIFQLGMVLWSLGEWVDEPEIRRPLTQKSERWASAPKWFKKVVEDCLSDKLQDRPSAKDILDKFP